MTPDQPLEIDNLEVAPDDLEAWAREILGAELLSWTEETTELGWPLAVVRARRPETGEHLLAGIYRFFHFVGAAAYAAPSAEELDAMAPAIRALLRRGRPDFGGDPLVLVSALWAHSEDDVFEGEQDGHSL